MLELDHLFVTTAPGALSLDLVLAHGLLEGTPNVHPGQGTANRRIFFRNVMLEFLWLTQREEAESELIRRTRLAERCDHHRHDVCPFGICLRKSSQPDEALPFATFAYTPPYLPAGMAIPMATNSARLDEPLIFCTPFGTRPDQAAPDRRQPLDHPAGIGEVTALKLTLPLVEPPSEAVRYLIESGLVKVDWAEHYQIQIEFDQGKQGQYVNFAPTFRFSFRW